MRSIEVIQSKIQERREINIRLRKTCTKTLKEINLGRFEKLKEAQSG